MNEEIFVVEIARVTKRLQRIDGTDEYSKAVRNLEILIDIKDKLFPKQQDPWYIRVLVNPATWGVASNVVISALVLNHERVNTITSKAWGFVRTR